MYVLFAVPGIADSFELMQTVRSFVSCAHTFAGGTTAGRSRVLISLLETQLSDRSVWCPDWDLSSLTDCGTNVSSDCVCELGRWSLVSLGGSLWPQGVSHCVCYRTDLGRRGDILLPNGPHLLPASPVLGSPFPPPGNCSSQCQRLVKRKGIIYSKVIQS